MFASPMEHIASCLLGERMYEKAAGSQVAANHFVLRRGEVPA